MALFRKMFYLIHKQNKPSSELQLRFLNQLSKLLRNGYSLIESLRIIQWDDDLRSISEETNTLLQNGNSIANALERVQFHVSITSYLSFVESSGDIKKHIEKCADMYQHRISYLKRLNQMIRYPLILIIIFSILLFFINRYVLPSFANLFHTNEEISSTINYSVTIINLLGKTTLILVIVSLFSWLIWFILRRKMKVSMQINIYKSVPVFRSFMTLYTSFLFATHLSTLLKSGMTIKQVLQHMSKQTNLTIISYYSSLLISEFSRGAHIDELLRHLPLIEKQFAVIFQKNNNISTLEKDLTVYADLLLEQFHRKMINTISMVQPIFFTVLSLFIIFIYVTLMWPMFDLIKTL